MKKTKKIVCVVLCLILTVGACCFTVSAESKAAYINSDGVRLRSDATTSSTILGTLNSGYSVTVNSTVTGQEVVTGNSTWYHITYEEQSGYVYGQYVSFPPSKDDYVYDENFEKNIQNFPESYRDALRALHSKYPNWKFKGVNVGMTLDEAVNTQYNSENFRKTRKYYTLNVAYGGDEWRDTRAYDATSNTWVQPEAGWTYASRSAIAYYMDPRNFLNENSIFMFMQQSYDSETQTKDALRKVLEGTFLEKGYDVNNDGTIAEDEKEAYLNDIISAAAKSKVSAYVIASKIIGEQSETSPLISGKYVYTYVDPNTKETVVEDYTGFYNFFNIGAYGPTPDDIFRRGLSHAKKQNPPWNSRTIAIEEGAKWYEDGYIGIGQDTYYFINFNLVNKNYNHQYATNVLDAYNKASNLKDAFINNTNAVVEFKIPIFTSMPSSPQQNTPTPEPVIKKGDINSDGIINAIDAAAIKMHILELKKLEGNKFKAADINGDGTINAIDAAAVKMHILDLKKIG